MTKKEYKKLVDTITPKEDRLKNSFIAFLIGGLVGVLGEILINVYGYYLNIPRKDAGILMILTFVLVASILTAFGIFDKMVIILKSALYIPITGFAHSITSAAMEYKNEGLVLGIGTNIFKLAGTVILYGVVSVYVFGILRLLILGG